MDRTTRDGLLRIWVDEHGTWLVCTDQEPYDRVLLGKNEGELHELIMFLEDAIAAVTSS
jgi:hypothetical protein